jgi:SAM-dependent methyltransferase
LRSAEERHFWFAARDQAVLALLERDMQGQLDVVDLGCGTGRFARKLAGSGHRVVAVEALEDPEDRPGASGDTIRRLRADVLAVPLADRSCDVAVALDVLEHVPEAEMLQEARRLLRPGGVIALSVPALPRLWSHRDVGAGHLRRYTRPALVAALQRADLETLEVRYHQFFLLPVMVLTRLLVRGEAGRDAEDHPPAFINQALRAISRLELRLADHVRYPLGSTLIALARRPRNS